VEQSREAHSGWRGAGFGFLPVPIQTIVNPIPFTEHSSSESKEAYDKVRRKENLCEKASPNHE
jgi:hypothetical protein